MGQLMQPLAGASAAPLAVGRLDSSRVVHVSCSPYQTIVVTDSGELYAAGGCALHQFVRWHPSATITGYSPRARLCSHPLAPSLHCTMEQVDG